MFSLIDCSIARSNNLLNHDCVGHIGAVTIDAFIDSSDAFFRISHIMLNGGSKYTKWFSQLIDIASYKASGSDIQEIYLCKFLLSLDAKKVYLMHAKTCC